MIENPTFAERLRAELDRSDLTITEAAGRVGVHYNTFRSYLNGKALPRKSQLVKIRRKFPAMRDVA